MSLIHSSKSQPRIFPRKGTATDSELDRVQSIDPTRTLNKERVEEIGRDGVVGYIKKSPTITYRMVQFETGNIETWNKLICDDALGHDVSSEDAITLDDFKNSYFDICAYLTDDDGTFKGTVHYPSLRVSGFSLAIANPQAIIERNFDFVGESAYIWQGNNKYFVSELLTPTPGSDVVITLVNTAVVDPDVASKYMIRVTRVASDGTVTELSKNDADYTENATTVTVATVSEGDKIRLHYTSGTAPTTIFTANNSDIPALLGDCADIYLYIPATLHPDSTDILKKLQSINIDVKFDREDLFEIGNSEVVQRGVKNKTVTVTLGKNIEDFSMDAVLRGESSTYGKIGISKFSDDITVIVKIYSDNTKDTLKYGMIMTNLCPTSVKGGAGVNAYLTEEATLEGEDLSITENEDLLD